MNQPDNRRIMALDLFSPFLFGIINNWTNFSFYHKGTWILRNQVWANSRKKVGICDRAKIIIPYTLVQDQYWEEVALRHGPINYRLHRWEKCTSFCTTWPLDGKSVTYFCTTWPLDGKSVTYFCTTWPLDGKSVTYFDLLLYNMTIRWEKCDVLLYNMTTIFWKDFMKFMLS